MPWYILSFVRCKVPTTSLTPSDRADLNKDQESIALIEQFWAAGKPVSSVCHGAWLSLAPRRS